MKGDNMNERINKLWELLLDVEWLGTRKLTTLARAIECTEEQTRELLAGMGCFQWFAPWGELWQIPGAVNDRTPWPDPWEDEVEPACISPSLN